jgi:N-acetylglucosaminyl-diphospho-decaprenol L-rhamnosyltransferase
MIDLAVVIVSWNVRELLLNALQSLLADLAMSRLVAEVYVVDSASSDGTVAAVARAFPHIKIITCQDNPGFAAANNLALRQLGFGSPQSADVPKAVYLLNPDTLTHAGATKTLFDTLLSDSQVGLVGAALQYADGSFQHSAFSFPGLRQLWAEFFLVPGRWIEGRFNGRYPRICYDSPKPFAVDFVLGATMMLRSEVIQQTGMFDEQFFMYCEEIDWAWRIHHAGWNVQCVPAAHVTHFGGQSTAQIRPQTVINLWTSRLLLFRKYYSPLKRWLAKWMVVVGMRWKMRQLAHHSTLSELEQQSLAVAYRAVYQRALNS